MFKRSLFYLGLSLCLALLAVGCGSIKDVSYFQDVQSQDSIRMVRPYVIAFQPGDKFSIIVSSKDPKLAALFNLPVVTYTAGSQLANGTSYNQVAMYTVDTNGDIDFPVLGKIHVGGQTREQLAGLIKGMLIGKDLVKDPVVTIDYGSMYFSVIGEVNHPGQYTIDHDQITLLDAISKAGDLTIYGLRDSVMVMRTIDGKQISYNTNLTNWKKLVASPAYYIHQNDVVYIKPNNTRKRQRTVNGNTFSSTSFWMSVASLLTSISVLFVR
jgi:polysaccharide export outer membrane protein